jgi:hypothetical protein
MPYWLHVIAYVAISMALYYLQDDMLFKPEKLSKNFPFNDA